MPAIIRGFLLIFGLMLLSSRASAVVLYSTPDRNTEAPGGLSSHDNTYGPDGPQDQRRLLNSGWQYQGAFRGFTGTPIAPNYFITAGHIGGEFDATNTFVYSGTTYTITTAGNVFQSPDSDLRIWRINETFPTWAPLYTGSDEVGKPLVVFGRGTQRGAEVRVNNVLKGWQWGASDQVLSWGENQVSEILNASGVGDALAFRFDAGAGRNEAAISLGDSGGGVFIESGGVWKLAGINLSTDGEWSFSNGGPHFGASLFDYGGMWHYNVSNGVYSEIMDQGTDLPVGSYATRISSNLAWIQSVIGPVSAAPVPEPTFAMLLIAPLSLLLRRSRHST